MNKPILAALVLSYLLLTGPCYGQKTTKERWQEQGIWHNFTDKEESKASDTALKQVKVESHLFSMPGTTQRLYCGTVWPKQTSGLQGQTQGRAAQIYIPGSVKPVAGQYGNGLPTQSMSSHELLHGCSRRTRPLQNIQTQPSKASGNYYQPSTADKSAAGSYYATPEGTPKAIPVYEINPEGSQGKSLQPLTKDRLPQ